MEEATGLQARQEELTTSSTEVDVPVKEFEPGRIQLLWRTGSYDGMMTGIGLLDGNPVYLDATDEPGGMFSKPKWQQLEDLLDELLEDEDADNLLDRLEAKYEDQMYEERPRVFKVRGLTPELFETARAQHRQWQLHGGLHSDFKYDKDGIPRYPGAPPWGRDLCWGTSLEYLKAHFYEPLDFEKTNRRDEEEMKKAPVLGTVTNSALYAPSDHRPKFPKDPRSWRLRLYQARWKPGDLVQLDW